MVHSFASHGPAIQSNGTAMLHIIDLVMDSNESMQKLQGRSRCCRPTRPREMGRRQLGPACFHTASRSAQPSPESSRHTRAIKHRPSHVQAARTAGPGACPRKSEAPTRNRLILIPYLLAPYLLARNVFYQ